MRVTKMHAIEENRALSPSQPDIASSQGHDPGFFSACMNDHSICTGEAAKRQSTAELLGNMAIPDKTPLPPDSVIERPLIGQLTRINTELVNAQRQLVKKNARLEKVSTQRFQILGMLAHDLRNPLTGILNASDLVLKEASGLLAESDLTLLQAIQSSSRFMLRLIDDMLEISTIESGKLRLDRKLTDILSLIQQNLSLNRRLAEHKQISIDVIASRALPRISIDPHKIYQVMDNLVTNAIKFSPSGSKVGITVRIGRELATISVQDRGMGIPANELETVFQPFRTGRHASSGAGTGLGLAIAKRIVEAHGGQLLLESQVGKGSTFTVTLPLSTHSHRDASHRGGLAAHAAGRVIEAVST